ncbi:MAG: alpha/beta hydrolase [Clostridiaceae bacterium]|nr:alpha/beta hydrolase [Clostridiaceae bacterium]
MWDEFKVKNFIFSERGAVIIYPNCKPNGRLLLKTEYLDAFPNFDVAMLERGYHLIHIAHRSRWAPDGETSIMADFARFCAKELQASERCVLEGMSCGGLQAARFAELYPELTAVMYLDAPVLNILSMAGLGECKDESVGSFWRELVSTFGVSKSTIVNFRKSPIDKMEPLIENRIPVIMLYGNADNTVIYEENGKVLEDYYQENGGTVQVIAKSMCGHHPHGLDDPSPIITFIEAHLS